MRSAKPIKRHKNIQTFSREHHHGLLLCWKIRTGLKRNVAPERIKKYADWFYKVHLLPHMVAEEEYLFPLLPMDHEWIIQAIKDHKNIQALFSEPASPSVLTQLADQLEKHIRFEERQLFMVIQDHSSEELMRIHHDSVTPFAENTEDVFWE